MPIHIAAVMTERKTEIAAVTVTAITVTETVIAITVTETVIAITATETVIAMMIVDIRIVIMIENANVNANVIVSGKAPWDDLVPPHACH